VRPVSARELLRRDQGVEFVPFGHQAGQREVALHRGQVEPVVDHGTDVTEKRYVRIRTSVG
jgi:hypothetical protein